MEAFKVKPIEILDSYKDFKVKYRDQGEILRNKIILDKNFPNFESLKTLIEDFNVLGSKVLKDRVETSIYGLVHINFLIYLIDIGIIGIDELKKYYNQLLDSKYFTNLEYHLDFYMLHAILGKEVNFYVSKGVTEPMFSEEFSELKRTYNFSGHFIVISLNYMLYKIGIKDAINIRSNIRELGKIELKILEEMRDINPGKISLNIEFGNLGNTIKEVQIKSKINDEDIKGIQKKAREMGYGKLEIKIHKGKTISGTGVKKIRLDKENK